jgi:hypothetical protein
VRRPRELPDPKPVTPAARGNHGGRLPIVLECKERPGKTFTKDEAAKLAGCQPQSVAPAMSVTKVDAAGWGKIGGYHFRRASPGNKTVDRPRTATRSRAHRRPDPRPAAIVTPSPAPTSSAVAVDPATYEARPRRRGDLGPINPSIIGGAARFMPAEVSPRGSIRLFKGGELVEAPAGEEPAGAEPVGVAVVETDAPAQDED